MDKHVYEAVHLSQYLIMTTIYDSSNSITVAIELSLKLSLPESQKQASHWNRRAQKQTE